jgi:PAS domain S-box-containing protein
MALLSFEGQILQANDALRELLGLDDTQLLQRSFQSFVVDADRIALGEQLARMSAQQFEGFSLEVRCRHQGGDEVWVSAHCSFFLRARVQRTLLDPAGA